MKAIDDQAAGYRGISLILHEERTVFAIAEPIRPMLQVMNHRQQRVQFGAGFVFDWEHLAFARPNSVHLLGPRRGDVAAPYLHEQSYFKAFKPLTVEAGKDELLYLPLYAHFHLREVGSYQFWIELVDDSGNLHRSNRFEFRLTDIESSLPSDLLEISLEKVKPAFALAEPVELEAVFSNKAERPVTFLKPQEGSLYGWANPIYQFSVFDQEGRGLALALRSGSMTLPSYDESTQFTLPPGQSYRQKLRLPDFPEMGPGEHRVRLSYIVRDKAVGKAGTILDESMNWKDGVFTGRIESNEIVLNIK